MQDPTGPEVSCMVVSYNQAPYIEECLASVFAQTHPSTEVVLIDDCSKDTSAATARAWLDRTGNSAQVLVNPRNRGLCATLNRALEACTGRYISIVAADDAWLPHKVAHQVAAARDQPDAVLVYSDAVIVDGEGDELEPSFLAWQLRSRPPLSGDTFSDLVPNNFIPAMATLFRREDVLALGGFDEDLSYEDWDMWLRLAKTGPFQHAPGVVARYRRLPGSLARTLGVQMHRDAYEIIAKHLDDAPVPRARLAARLEQIAKTLWAQEHPDAPGLLRDALVRTRNPALIVPAALASVRIPYAALAGVSRR